MPGCNKAASSQQPAASRQSCNPAEPPDPEAQDGRVGLNGAQQPAGKSVPFILICHILLWGGAGFWLWLISLLLGVRGLAIHWRLARVYKVRSAAPAQRRRATGALAYSYILRLFVAFFPSL